MIQLRDTQPADLPLFFEHQRDSVAVAMVGFRSRDRATFDHHWATLLANRLVLTKTLVVDDVVAGHVVSWLSDARREVGYWIGRAFWGRGIATAALNAFLRIETTRPLYAGVARHNIGSIRVLQKCGFAMTSSEEKRDDSHLLFVLR